jgi:hypothetical protein
MFRDRFFEDTVLGVLGAKNLPECVPGRATDFGLLATPCRRCRGSTVTSLSEPARRGN